MARIGYSVLFLSCVMAMSAHVQASMGAQDASQPDAEAETAPQPAATAAVKEKRICRREDITGSRFTKKVCMTQSEWDHVRNATREAMRDMDSRPQNPYVDQGGG